MIGSKIKAEILSIQEIPFAEKSLLLALDAPKGYVSLGIITTTIDDISYAALDEATKKADVKVVYAHSMYGGAVNASTSLAGEFIGIIAGKSPDDVKSGIDAAAEYIEGQAFFYSAADDDSIVYFAHCISRAGSFLAEKANIEEGQSLAYCIAPPSEALCGLDSAMKSAQVELKVFYGPPTETNFAGGLLTGEQSACDFACKAFAEAVCVVANKPLSY